MKIIPSIDLKNGKCVRLQKGDFNQITQYDVDPIQQIKDYERAGVSTVHLVDLDGAKNRSLAQFELIQQLRNSTNLELQVGGGLRSEPMIAKLLEIGLQKIVVGSLAVRDPELTKKLIHQFGSQYFVIALDIRLNASQIPIVALEGWETNSSKTLWSLLDEYSDLNSCEILCTDIDKDGMLLGPNFNLYRQCISQYPNHKFQASGGIRNLEDLKQLKTIGLSSAIIGKALYENQIDLKQAIVEVMS